MFLYTYIPMVMQLDMYTEYRHYIELIYTLLGSKACMFQSMDLSRFATAIHMYPWHTSDNTCHLKIGLSHAKYNIYVHMK